MRMTSRLLRIALAAGAAVSLTAPTAEAHITRLVIDRARSESPTFEGRVFGQDGSVGPYEKLRGKAYGEVDPNDPRNALMTDIKLAPRNARGRVEYSMDIFILKPVDLRRGGHKLMLDVNNRGEMRVAALNDAPGTNNPTTAAHAGTGFIMNLGYSIVGNGWDVGTSDGLTISVPIAKNPDGTSITGPSYEYINFDEPRSTRYALTYPAATLDKAKAVLTVRAGLDEQPTVVPAGEWEYVDAKTIRLLPADTPFKQSHVYEFRYTAKDPVVAALGLAATRDFVSFLRHATKDEAGNPNPLAGDVRYTYSFSISQPSRTLNDFQAFGFNEDEQGARVIDGMLKWVGGGSGDQINYRFAQTGRTERNRQDHLYPEGIFPFAYPEITDHISRRTGGRNVRCTASNTCPKVFDANSANEYWVKAASLLHTDTQGRDLPDPANVRFYLISGLSHGVGNAANKGLCQQFLNPNSPFPVLRALLTALDQWVTQGTEPPPSRVPRLADKTAVLAVARPGHQTGVVPQNALGWPTIQGVTYTGLVTTRYHLDFGSGLDKGIISNYPSSTADRPAYPSFVSKVDADGNEIAGIRVPPVEAPVATTTGWALRRAEFGENNGCEGSGQYVPFAATQADRATARDPRLSLEERYRTHDGYVAAVTKAAETLHNQRFLLPADVRRYAEQAQSSDVLRNAVSSAQSRSRTTLDIYVVDVEGGNATLFVAPSGESVLIDAGNGGAAAARDAGRIADAARDAGITQIDHHITTHWHGDHFGGLEALAALLPIKAYYDHGPTVEPQPASTEFLASVYPKLTAGGIRHIVKPGDRIPIKALDWRIVASAGRVLESPLPGAGERNPYCAAFTPKDPDPTENAQSVSSYITFGRFRVVHPGDLTWNKEGDLMCPVNRLGTADLLIVGHHGQPISNSPPIVHGLRPRVSIINNGTRKGGQPDAMKIILNSPGLEDVWQSHFSLLSGQEYTVPGMFIGNMLDEQPDSMPIGPMAPPSGAQAPPPPQHNGKAFWFKIVAQQDGTFTVTNTRNNVTKTYRAGGR